MKGLRAFLKFVPVFVLAGLMICGKGHLFDGQDAMIAAPLAFLVAVVIAMLVEKKNGRNVWMPRWAPSATSSLPCSS